MGPVRFRGARGFQYSGAAFVANPATAGALITTRSHAALRILVSNDDGYRAEGLHQLAEALRPLASVTVVAPDRNRSGASNSLT